MNLREKRAAIRHLLDERSPVDALAAYYAFHHDDARTDLILGPISNGRAGAYVGLARTGMDLFRPLVTMRLNLADLDGSAALLHQALPPEAPVLISAPAAYGPLLAALFALESEERLQLLRLDPRRFKSKMNVLVTPAATPNGRPRFVIRQPHGAGGDMVTAAAASVNWQSPYFAEIGVTTESQYRQRGFGRAVVTALAEQLLADGRIPLYLVTPHNQASRLLADRVGFVDTGAEQLLLAGALRPNPAGFTPPAGR